jgi:hypothetical protein
MRRQARTIEQKAPSVLRRLAQALCSAFTRPTYYRIVVLLLAAQVRAWRRQALRK